MEIIREILVLSSGRGITKTALVYRANSNFNWINETVDSLVVNGLIQKVVEDGTHLYRTTTKGEEVLAHLSAALGALSATPEVERATPRF